MIVQIVANEWKENNKNKKKKKINEMNDLGIMHGLKNIRQNRMYAWSFENEMKSNDSNNSDNNSDNNNKNVFYYVDATTNQLLTKQVGQKYYDLVNLLKTI